MSTWVVYRYPTISTRVDAEYYDEVDCERGVAEDLAKALQRAYSPNWWFFIKCKMQDTIPVRNWEDTGRFQEEDRYVPPVGDPQYDALKELVGYEPKSHHYKYHAKDRVSGPMAN